MSESNELIDYVLIDEIRRLLDRFQWISSYELFYQKIEKIETQLIQKHRKTHEVNLKKKSNSGISLRIISKSRRLVETSLGISSLHKITNLTEPKSTQKKEEILIFPQLKNPRIKSIAGDQSKSFNFQENTVLEKLEDLKLEDPENEFEESSNSLNLERETRYIINTGSNGISNSSLKVNLNHSVKILFDYFVYTISRNDYRRNLNFNRKQLELDVFENRVKRSKRFVNANLDDVSIIFHPNIIGKIIAFQSNSLISNPRNQFSPIWNDQIHLYDDPLREEGYASTLFDDEGNITKSKVLVEKGNFQNSLNTIITGGPSNSGNGYRSAWFQPLSRSYEYPVSRAISNLVMMGGIGKGINFVQKRTVSLLVVKGHGYIGGMANNPKFVIHASEAELWKNGEYLGPTYNYTFSGSLNEIMKYGDLSADQTQVVDKAIPGAVYIGWLRCPPGIIKVG
ncbi:MAG: hypothetical protein HeimC2_24050 [Candidatus Heimdallarchaeota archaeon LC_2]|nr:MAG: hypothetical protein HeimC2_24050 [Candidatus Heimdallarchaeota archaeon LC_2]